MVPFPDIHEGECDLDSEEEVESMQHNKTI
jgi:hypothetical protein